MLYILKLAVGYPIELYIIYIIYNLNQSYLFDFQRDKNFNLGKTVFLIMLPVITVITVIKILTILTVLTPKNVILSLYFYLRALKKI